MNPIFLTRSLFPAALKSRGLFLICTLLVCGSCLTTISCATAHGFGRDVEHTGEKIKEASSR